MSEHALLVQLDACVSRSVPRRGVQFRGEWSSSERRTYASSQASGSASGPFKDVVDVRWRGTLASDTPIGAIAFLLHHGELHWCKSPEIASSLTVEISLHAYAHFQADRATFEWEQYAARYGPKDDAEADPGSVIFSVPAPPHPTHQLEIVQRGNTIEVAYDCGIRAVRAEQQFIFAEEEFDEAVAALQAFLHQLVSGTILIVREPLGRVVRAIRRDGVTELASFRPAAHGRTLKPGLLIHRWTGSG